MPLIILCLSMPSFPLVTCLTPLPCFGFLQFQILILQGLRQEVTCLCPSPDGLHLAVGYEDGSIRIFSLLSGEGNVTFNGHKAAVMSLKYDQLGGRLASGSKVRASVRLFDLVTVCKALRDVPKDCQVMQRALRILNCVHGRNRVSRMGLNWEARFLS